MITRYVNTASTPGGDGTTNATSGANRAYASLATLLTTYRLTTLTDVLRVYCSGTAADTNSLDHTALEFYTTPTNYLEVIGDNTTGKWNPSAYRIEVTDINGIYNQYAAHVRLYNLQVMVKITTATARSIIRLSTANNDLSNGAGYFIVKNCIARRDPTSSGAGVTYGFNDSIMGDGSGGSMYRINCLSIGATYGFATDSSVWVGANLYNYNCTGYGNTYNFVDLQKCVNCLSANPLGGAGTGFISTGAAGTSNNAADDATAPGTSSRQNQTFSFVDAANGDLHLLSTDAGAKGFGLTDPGSGLYLDDIDGQTRVGAWDIGADEYVLASGGASLLTVWCG